MFQISFVWGDIDNEICFVTNLTYQVTVTTGDTWRAYTGNVTVSHVSKATLKPLVVSEVRRRIVQSDRSHHPMIPFRRPRRALVPRTNPHASDRGLTPFASGLSGQSHGLRRAQSRWCLPIPRCRASAAPEQLSICPVLALSTNRLTLTYSMRTRLLGRLPQLTALGALITRRSRGWRRWQAARLAEATADGLRTLAYAFGRSRRRERGRWPCERGRTRSAGPPTLLRTDCWISGPPRRPGFRRLAYINESWRSLAVPRGDITPGRPRQ